MSAERDQAFKKPSLLNNIKAALAPADQ